MGIYCVFILPNSESTYLHNYTRYVKDCHVPNTQTNEYYSINIHMHVDRVIKYLQGRNRQFEHFIASAKYGGRNKPNKS